MADDPVDIKDASGATVPIAADSVASSRWQYVKVAYGADGAATRVDGSSPLPTYIPDPLASGNITANGQSVTLTTLGSATAALQITGTWAATLQVEATVDGTNFFNVPALVPTTGAVATSTTANGQWLIPCAGYKQVRIRCSAFTSGTAVVSLQGSIGASAVAVYTGGDGSVQGVTAHDAAVTEDPLLMGGVASAAAPTAVSADGDKVRTWHGRNGELKAQLVGGSAALIGGDATNGLDVDVTRLIPGTAATELGKAEDAVHNSGDVGVMALAVRRDSATSGGADGDYAPLSLTSNGSLRTDGSGATQPVSGTVTAAGAAAHDAAVSGNPALLAGRAETPDDTAPSAQVSAEGDVTTLATDRDGAIYTHPHPPRIWHASAEYTSQQTDTSVKATPGAGLSLYITDIFISCNAAVDITLEEGTTTLKFKHYADAKGSGVSRSFVSPIKLSANTALTVTSSGAVTFTLVVSGYTAP